MGSKPIASVSTHLSVPSHSRPTRRPSRSMCRVLKGTKDPFGKSSGESLSGSRGYARRQKDRGHSQWLWGGAQLAVDTALVSPLNFKERTYPELLRSRRCMLVGFAIETEGRWNPEATTFLRVLAQTKSTAFPNIFRKAVEAFLPSRWSAIRYMRPGIHSRPVSWT